MQGSLTLGHCRDMALRQMSHPQQAGLGLFSVCSVCRGLGSTWAHQHFCLILLASALWVESKTGWDIPPTVEECGNIIGMEPRMFNALNLNLNLNLKDKEGGTRIIA